MLKKILGREQKDKVFIIGFHVKPMENTIMPPDMDGAYVDCFCMGNTYEDAAKNSLDKLAKDGLYPEEVLESVLEMEIEQWSTYVKDRWPDYLDGILAQQDFETTVRSGGVVYGPFTGYNPRQNENT